MHVIWTPYWGACGENMKLFKKHKNFSYNLSEKDNRWNKFIEDVCFRDLSSLSTIQKKAVICFKYDAEMNNGGFSLYRDCYPETNSTELKEALIEISSEDIANNYINAFEKGEKDDFLETDMKYGTFSPSLCEYIQEYVEKYKDCIFD